MSSQYVTPQWIRSNAELLAHVINATYHLAQHQERFVPEITPDGYCIMRREISECLYATPTQPGPINWNPENSVDEVDLSSLTVNVGSTPPSSPSSPNIVYASLQSLTDEELLNAVAQLDEILDNEMPLVEYMDETGRIINQINDADSTTNRFEVDLERQQGEGCDARSETHREVPRWYQLPTSPPPSQSTEQPFRAEGTSESQGETEVPVSSPEQKEGQIYIKSEEQRSMYDFPASSRPISYNSPPTPRPFIMEPPRGAPYYYSETSAAQNPSPPPRPRWRTETCPYSEDHRAATHHTSCLWSCWRNAVHEEACDSIEYYQV